MPGEKKYRNFAEFLNEFMAVCRKHREISETTRKPSHASNYRTNCDGNKRDSTEMFRRESHQRFYDHKEKSPVITSAPEMSVQYQKPVTVVVPVRCPPPVPGPCLQVLKTGNCKAYDIGRCIYNHSAEALAAQIKKEQENVNTFLARSFDIDDAIPASSCTQQGYVPLEIVGDVEVEVEVCLPPKEPYIVVDGTVAISDSLIDDTVATPTVSIIVPVLEQVIASIMSLYGSSVVSYNRHYVTGRAYLRSIGYFVMLFDAVCGSVLLFGGWSILMFSEGFPPGPPKKPPPWFVYIKILVIFGTSNLWLY
jgi:hypothetical protein